MHSMTEKPKNHTIVFVEDSDGVLDFAFYSDGMFVKGIHNFQPTNFKGWISIGELKQKLDIK